MSPDSAAGVVIPAVPAPLTTAAAPTPARVPMHVAKDGAAAGLGVER